jgi:hypothetical protein
LNFGRQVSNNELESLKADAPSIASRLTSDEEASAAWRDAKVSGLSTVLDAKSVRKLDLWANTHLRNRILVLTTDYATLLSSPQAAASMSDRIGALCGSAAR